MVRKCEHHEERTHDNSGQENRGQHGPQYMAGLLVLVATAICILGYMLSLDPRHRPGAVIAFYVAWLLIGLGHRIAAVDRVS